MNSCQLHDALKDFHISSHFPFNIFTLHFIFYSSHACCCLNEEKIKLNNSQLDDSVYIYFLCSGSVVVTAYDFESNHPGSNPEWGSIH